MYFGTKFSGYLGFGGEGGTITLAFDNGYAQDYGFIGVGLGVGKFGMGLAVAGHVYDVFHPDDFVGAFTDTSLSVPGWGGSASWTPGGGAAGYSTGPSFPGAAMASQYYWKIGKPYRFEN